MNVTAISQLMNASGPSGAAAPGQSQGGESAQFGSMLKEKIQASRENRTGRPGEEQSEADQGTPIKNGMEEEEQKGQKGLTASISAFQPQPLFAAIAGQGEAALAAGEISSRISAEGLSEAEGQLGSAAGREPISSRQIPEMGEGTLSVQENQSVPSVNPADSQGVKAPEAAPAPQKQDGEGQLQNRKDQGTAPAGPAGEESGKNSRKEMDGTGVAQPQAPLFEKVETVPIKVAQTQEAEGLLKDAAQKLKAPISDALERGASRMEIALSPRSLGELAVEITRSGDGSLHVMLRAASERTAALLEHHSSGLQNLLAGNAQTPVRVEVQHQGDNSSAQQFLNPEGEGQGGRQHQRQESQQRQRTQDFIQQLRLGLVGLDEAVS